MPKHSDVLMEIDIPGRKPIVKGKVRRVYRLNDGWLGIITTDHISAFDIVLANGIAWKGIVLNLLSKFWFETLPAAKPHHMLSTDLQHLPADFQRPELWGRTMLCMEASGGMTPAECVVRGYIDGSGWDEYQKSGQVCGITLPKGLKRCQKLPDEFFPIFTPTTKAPQGQHDKPLTFQEFCALVGGDVAAELRLRSVEIYRRAHDIAIQKNIIIADTKFEFGIRNGGIMLVDEVLTPDSSRFWPAMRYEPGRSQESFDKQPVRDYLKGLQLTGQWDGKSTPPPLPEEVAAATTERYLAAYKFLTGETLAG